ncbi:hypothetical protein Tco_0425582 [Tanacetum coccineum]
MSSITSLPLSVVCGAVDRRDDDTIAFLHLCFCNCNQLLGRDGCHPPRKNTLLRDYKSIGKSSVFVDNSIGEQNEELGGLITRFCDRSEKCGYLSYRRRSPLRDKSTKLEEAGVEVQLYDEALYTIVVVTVVVGHLLRPLDIGSCCSKIDIVPEHNFKELHISFTGLFIPINVVLATLSRSIVGFIVAWVANPPYPYFKFTIIQIAIGYVGRIYPNARDTQIYTGNAIRVISLFRYKIIMGVCCGVSGHANLLSTLISLTAHDDVEVGKLTDIEIKAFLLICLICSRGRSKQEEFTKKKHNIPLTKKDSRLQLQNLVSFLAVAYKETGSF